MEVIILPHERVPAKPNGRYPLRGSIRRYDQPLDPAADASDWGALVELGRLQLDRAVEDWLDPLKMTFFNKRRCLRRSVRAIFQRRR